MNFRRIWAVFLRYFYFFAKLEQVSELFYFPAIDILLWGMASIWMQSHEAEIPKIALTILSGLIFWQIIWRATYEIAVNLLQEYWSRNLMNLFSTPLKLSEWMMGTMLLGILKIIISLFFGILLVWLLYSLNIFTMGWAFLPFSVSLTLSGWFIGFLTGSVLIYFGQRIQMLAWIMPLLFAPFSAVFYPVAVLPSWAQVISYALPTSYIFEGMRQILLGHAFSYSDLYISLVLNLVYLTLSILLFKYMFEKSRIKGLGRLE